MLLREYISNFSSIQFLSAALLMRSVCFDIVGWDFIRNIVVLLIRSLIGRVFRTIGFVNDFWTLLIVPRYAELARRLSVVSCVTAVNTRADHLIAAKLVWPIPLFPQKVC